MDPTHAERSSRPETSASSAAGTRRPEDAPADAATRSANLRDAVLLAELTQKLGSVEKARKVYALFSANQMASATAAPPPTIPEDSTAQTAVSHDEEPKASTRAPDSGFQRSETAPSTSAPKAENEEATGELAADDGSRDGSESVEPEGRGIDNPNSEGKQKGETPVSEKVVEGETPVLKNIAEEETPVLGSMEGETPVERNAEGETPDETGNETPRNFRGETPEPTEGQTLGEFVGDETLDKTEVQVPVGEEQQFVVDLEDDQEEEEPLVDKRAERRRIRRSILDEADDLDYSKKEEFPARGTAGGQEETPGLGDEAEDSRLAKERKRKGKQAVTVQLKRSRKTASVEEIEEPILPPTKVPFAKELSGPVPESESESEE